MAVADKIEIDLSTLKQPRNVDAVEHIALLLRTILYSEEVTPSSDETGEWPQDFMWEIDTPKITLRKVEYPTHRGRYVRG